MARKHAHTHAHTRHTSQATCQPTNQKTTVQHIYLYKSEHRTSHPSLYESFNLCCIYQHASYLLRFRRISCWLVIALSLIPTLTPIRSSVRNHPDFDTAQCLQSQIASRTSLERLKLVPVKWSEVLTSTGEINDVNETFRRWTATCHLDVVFVVLFVVIWYSCLGIFFLLDDLCSIWSEWLQRIASVFL